MCTESKCKQVTVTVNLCDNDALPTDPTDPTPKDCCFLVPYGKHMVFRNEANDGNEIQEALDGEIFIGYYNGVYGKYKRISATEVQTITSNKNA